MSQKPVPPIPFPEYASLTATEAANWYLQGVRSIPAHVNRDKSPGVVLEAAHGLKSRLRLAAALALFEPALIDEFLRKMPIPSLADLFDEVGGWDGDESERKALVQLLKITDLERRAFPGTVGEAIGLEVSDGQGGASVMTESGWKAKEEGGFPPGFPVKTPTGFKRIEQVQPGDIVLSAPPDGSGSPQPKKVLRTFRREARTLLNTSTQFPGPQGPVVGFAAHDATLLWVEGCGWSRFDEIPRESRIRTREGPGEFSPPSRVYRTTRPGIGWEPAWNNPEEAHGSLFDYANYLPVPTSEAVYLEQEVWESNEHFLRLTVHDLDVEDFKTYYVADHWVRGPVSS